MMVEAKVPVLAVRKWASEDRVVNVLFPDELLLLLLLFFGEVD